MKKILIGALFILESINTFAAKEYYVDSGTPGSNKGYDVYFKTDAWP